MRKSYCLKSVNVLLKYFDKKVEFENMIAQLKERGITCSVQLYDNKDRSLNLMPDTIGTSEKKKENRMEPEGRMDKEDGVLWITDSVSLASKLTAMEKPLLVYFHEQNREDIFTGIQYGMENPMELDIQFLENVYRRLKKIPWEILQTKRCLIRETIPEDVDAFYQIYSDPTITKYTEDLYPDREEEKRYIQEYIEKVYYFYQFGVWTILLRSTGEIIGRAGFNYRCGYEDPELGFVFGVPWQHQGIAYEVCSALLDYGRMELDFHRVLAIVSPDNVDSLALCGRLGFHQKELFLENGKEYLLLESI